MTLNSAQQEQLLKGMDMVLSAIGAPTIADLLVAQEGLMAQFPEDIRPQMMKHIEEQVKQNLGMALAVSGDQLKKALTSSEFLDAMKQQFGVEK